MCSRVGWSLRHIVYPDGGRECEMGGEISQTARTRMEEYTDKRARVAGASVERELVCGLGEQGDAYE